MSKALPATREFTSKDNRRHSRYMPLKDLSPHTPPGLEQHKGPLYQVKRTVRTRRGFGTIIHTLTTFTNTRLKAHKLAANWVKIQTRDR
jgi:hypothetical protein